MALFDAGVRSSSTSIGGSTQTINFNPVLNARGSTSGNVASEGVTLANRNILTDTQGTPRSSDSESFSPGLSLDSQRGALPLDHVAPSSFVPGSLPDANVAGRAGASPFLLPALALVAVVGFVFFVRS